jgi:hypothetical protein
MPAQDRLITFFTLLGFAGSESEAPGVFFWQILLVFLQKVGENVRIFCFLLWIRLGEFADYLEEPAKFSISQNWEFIKKEETLWLRPGSDSSSGSTAKDPQH